MISLKNVLFYSGVLAFTVVGVIAVSSIDSGNKTIPEVSVPSTELVESSTEKSVEKGSKKVSRLDVDSEQVIVFNQEVNTISVDLAIDKIVKLEDKYDDLYLILDSPGGSVFDGSRLIAYMRGSKSRINTVCLSLCASMAAQIFSNGKTRYMVEGSTLMFHPAAGGVRGTIHEMDSLLSYIKYETKKLDAYVADRAGIDRDKWYSMVQDNLWVGADTAIDLKLADKLAVIPLKAEQLYMSPELKRKTATDTTTTIPDILTKNPLKDIN